jgi:hypothetical protein
MFDRPVPRTSLYFSALVLALALPLGAQERFHLVR